MVRSAVFHEGYEVRQEGDKQIITFCGDGLSGPSYVALPISTLMIVGGLAAILPASLWPVPVVLLCGLGYMVYTMFQAQTFTLTPTAIVKGDVEYDRAKISEVMIDNPLDASVSLAGQPSMMIGGTGLSGASMAAMAGASMALSRSAAKRRHRVLIRYGSRTVKMARNLSHDRAVAIFNLLARQ